MFSHSMREKHGVRWWLHFGGDKVRGSVLRVEFYWWTHFCHVGIETDSEPEWTLSVALPPFALWVSFQGFGLWHPQRKCIATWDDCREFWIPDDRECKLSINDWTLRLNPWSKSMEWVSTDPWWIRGVSFDVKRFVLGKMHYSRETVKENIPLLIPMPEGVYKATAIIERATWRRQRWFPKTRTFVNVNVPKGIPHAGKGENSWDCGDDALCGYSVEGESLEKAIAHGVESVLTSRRRYGRPSAESITKALTTA